ncbi:MAG: selenium-dependent xanthine dehydrogenase [Chloroflexi bacterium]|nr:MAG: selenium-dependent xanthine dehydrogenase [Chloroflexota bacterium]MBL1196429.1 selenium-dependent xanthine dehydrogenase [Chloroflexota bacterium]NOH13724.1 selenium-dependent xanthine dehydrogenase [Chloroflexota bacterium]
MIRFTLNQQPKEFDGNPDLPLLTYLREHENIISPKDGCAPQAACGCCVVDVNNKAVLACVTPMSKVADGNVLTTEGLGEYRQSVFSNAFVSKGGVQCGFCIPGIVMQSNALINKNPQPTRDDVEKALTPNLCRCTGYKKIVDAVMYAAEVIHKEEEIEVPQTEARIGDRHPKYKSQALVLGQHAYVDDIRMEGMAYGALKFSDHPRAKVLKIDTSKAEVMEGIHVFTASDFPGDRYVGLIKQDWPQMIAEGETTNYVGDVLALVVAESDSVAREAVGLIRVEYEVLEPIIDMHTASQPSSPKVHANLDDNILSTTTTSRGDLNEATEQSAFVAEGVFETQMIEHGFMEPESAVAYPTDDGLEVLSQSQGIFDDRNQIAKLLDLPIEKIRIKMVPNGGGFGGKEDLSVQGHAALAAHLLQRPVKVRMTRDESIAFHPKRHPIWMEYKIGSDGEGKLTFCKVKFLGDTGAYASVGMKVLERSAGHATGAYNFPVTNVESTAVYTNNLPCGAMRGFGVNQAAFGLESLIDELCEKGGFDRWQFRYDNALQDGDMTATGQIIESGAGVRETLLAVKDEYQAAKYAGIACGIKNTGIGNGMPDASSARITIEAADKVLIDHGWTEMGQGVNTIALQVVCNETSIDPALVEVRIDTVAEQEAGMTTASRATSLVGNALIDACKELKKDLESNSLADLVGKQYDGEWVVDWTTKPGAMVEKVYTHYSYSYATQLVTLDEDGNFEKITAAHDAGKIFNPTLFEGQLEGSIHMGLGYAISEELEMENGRPKSTRLRKMGILRAKEMPEMEVIGVEVPDPHGPYGAKGVGEIGLVPTAGAVANALYQYDGVRRYKLPMRIPKRGLDKRKA